MKHVLVILFLLISCTVWADDSGSSDPIPLPKKTEPPTDPIKHKMPSHVYLTFYYNEGVCYFYTTVEYESLDVIFFATESGVTYTGSCSASDPTIEINLPKGEYVVTCTTDTDDIFEGTVEIH